MKQCSRILDIKFFNEEELSDNSITLYRTIGQSISTFTLFSMFKTTATENVYKITADSNIFCKHLETETSLRDNYHIIIRDNHFFKMSRIEYVTGDNQTHITYFDDEAKAEESFNELMENNKSNLISITSMDDYLTYNSSLKKEEKK